MNSTPKLPELTIPTHLATPIASAELLYSAAMRTAERLEVYTTRDAETRKARTIELFKATERYMDAAATIAFYQARYGVPAQAPAPAMPYTHERAVADAQAAGLPYVTARRISLDAVAAGLTGSDYRAYCDAHVAMQLDEQAARRNRNAAKWAQMQAVGA
jgi:hypothetical protein